MGERPTSRMTVALLALGSIVSASLFVVGFTLRVLGQSAPADIASLAGVVVLLATPPVGLLATAAELRRIQPAAAALALVVVAILAMATFVAVAAIR